MSLTIINQDITQMKVDAVVNAANTELLMGGGVCGAIFRAAGAEALQKACDELAPIKTGEAVITPGFDLPAKYIVHTAGPIYKDGRQGEEELLRAAYLNSMRIAEEKGCESIAFPLISSGIYGYPPQDALRVAIEAIRIFMENSDIEVYLSILDKKVFVEGNELEREINEYLYHNYLPENKMRSIKEMALERGQRSKTGAQVAMMMAEEAAPRSIDDLINNLDESFSETLLKLIDAKGKTDVEVYKRANLDRKHFSKIRTDKNYRPSKKTALALAIALELSLAETEDLLERAGYTLSHSQIFDVIVEFFIIKGKYDVFEINKALFKYDQAVLGGGL